MYNFTLRSPQFGKIPNSPKPTLNRGYRLVLGDSQGSMPLAYVRKGSEDKPFVSWPYYRSNNELHSFGVVHALTIYKDDKNTTTPLDDEPMVYFVTQKRLPMVGKMTVESPGGRYGERNNPHETAEKGAFREVAEETPYIPVSEDAVQLLSRNTFSSTPGLTNEQKNFAITFVRPKTDAENNNYKIDPHERTTIQKNGISVPFKVFLDREQFTQWLSSLQTQGYITNMDIPVMRGLLPDKKTLNQYLYRYLGITV